MTAQMQQALLQDHLSAGSKIAVALRDLIARMSWRAEQKDKFGYKPAGPGEVKIQEASIQFKPSPGEQAHNLSAQDRSKDRLSRRGEAHHDIFVLVGTKA